MQCYCKSQSSSSLQHQMLVLYNSSAFKLHCLMVSLEEVVDAVALRRLDNAAPVQVVAHVRVLVVPPHGHLAHRVHALFLVRRVARLVLICRPVAMLITLKKIDSTTCVELAYKTMNYFTPYFCLFNKNKKLKTEKCNFKCLWESIGYNYPFVAQVVLTLWFL